MVQTKPRLELIDSLRGLALIGMILYHAAWDLVFLFGINLPGYQGLPGHLWQQTVCWTFILLAGFSWQLSRSHWKRGLWLLLGGGLVTWITWLFLPAQYVCFGVLTFLGSCTLLWIALDPLLHKLSPFWGMIGCFALFIASTLLTRKRFFLPEQFSHSFLLNSFLAWLGFPQPGFTSSDYFPLLPWAFLFGVGYFLYSALQHRGLLEKLLARGKIPVVSLMGRHSLLVYLLHQPICYGLCLVVLPLVGLAR